MAEVEKLPPRIIEKIRIVYVVCTFTHKKYCESTYLSL